VPADGVEAIVTGDARILIERCQDREAGARPMNHRDGDRAIQRHHRIVGDLFEHAVEREDLRPISLLGASGLVVETAAIAACN